MRLTEDQIKQGILHAEPMVRDAALRYFCDSFSSDPTVMPLAIQAIEKYGWTDAFQSTRGLADLAQTEEMLLGLIDQVNRMGRPRAQRDQERCLGLSRVITHADVSLLMKHEQKVLALEGLEAECRDIMADRLRLLTVDTDACWGELERFCEANKGRQYIDNVDVPQANRLVEALARDATCADRVLRTLLRRVEDDEDNSMAWMEGLAVRLAGEMHLEAAVPLLIAKLMADCGDYVNGECLYALVRIGTDSTVEAVCKGFASAPDHYRLHASSLLSRIHSDLAVRRCLELAESETDEDIRVNLIGGVLSSFCLEGIAPARQLMLRHIFDLQRELVAAATLMGVFFPELETWKKDLNRRDQQTRQRMEDWAADAPAVKPKPKLPAVAGLGAPPLPAPIVGKKPVGRNAPCPCGSGKKYKKCCMNKGA